jgi:hypothetical protein
MKKTVRNYALLSVGLFGLTRFYALFAHGVSSWSMELMALAVLIAGSIWLILQRTLQKEAPYIGWLSLTYHTALVFLINYLFIKGVLSIAGGSSVYVTLLLSLSEMFGLIAVGLYLFIWIRTKSKTA